MKKTHVYRVIGTEKISTVLGIVKAGTHTRRNSHKSHKCRRSRRCHKSPRTLRNLLDLLEFYDERTHTNLG